MTTLRLLLVEDSENDAMLLVRELERGGLDVTCKRVYTEEAYVDALERGEWDFVIADFSMPGFSGADALRLLRERERETPFVFVSGTIGEETAVEAMRTGAQDYILKGALQRLVPVIERELREAESRRQKRELHEQLLQAQKMESMGRLAGGIAHDFNNLLTVVIGVAELLALRPELDPEIADLVHEIREAADRAAVLTRQLLAFSRKQIVAPMVLDVNALVKETERLIRRLIGEDIEVVTSLAPHIGYVLADRSQLEQVLINLVVNARDALPGGGVLEIQTECWRGSTVGKLLPGKEAAEEYVELVVRDDGIGMTDEVRAQVFEPFFSTKGRASGTGLGLSTCYAIVRDAGGWIEAESTLGVGTAMKVFLPVTKEPPARLNEMAAELRRGSETILLVDDEASVRGVLRRALEAAGYKVVEAADGPSGLEAFNAARFDLVVTDVVLPGFSGRELVDRILATSPQTPVIFISGYAEDTMLQHRVSRRAGCFLEKPLTMSAITSKVRRVLDASKERDGERKDPVS